MFPNSLLTYMIPAIASLERQTRENDPIINVKNFILVFES
jgi:hypothetical protein